MNNWKIPAWLEREVIERDRSCVYCGVSFAQVSNLWRERPSWEHIVNDATIVTRDNIALCCIGCNASKGAKDVGPVVSVALLQRPADFRAVRFASGPSGPRHEGFKLHRVGPIIILSTILEILHGN
jgi:hypothetical protein